MSNLKKRLLNIVLPIVLSIVIIVPSIFIFLHFMKRDPTVIRIVRENNYANIVSNVKEHLGLMQKHLPAGYSVQFVEIAGMSNARDALIAGQVDFMIGPRSNMLPAIENGMPLAVVSNAGGGSESAYYSRRADVTCLDTLLSTGARIIRRNQGSLPELALRMVGLREYGNINQFSSQFSTLQWSSRDELLEFMIQGAPNFDVAEFSFPHGAHAIEAGLHMVFDLTPVYQQYELSPDMYTHKNTVNNRWYVVEAFNKARVEAIDILINNPDLVLDHLALIYGLDKEVIRQQLLLFPPYHEVIKWNETADALLELGILTSPATRFEDLFNYDKIPK